jgi:hypothetical protein
MKYFQWLTGENWARPENILCPQKRQNILQQSKKLIKFPNYVHLAPGLTSPSLTDLLTESGTDSHNSFGIAFSK